VQATRLNRGQPPVREGIRVRVHPDLRKHHYVEALIRDLLLHCLKVEPREYDELASVLLQHLGLVVHVANLENDNLHSTTVAIQRMHSPWVRTNL